MMDTMPDRTTDWVVIATYENLPGCPPPWAAVRA